MRCVTQSERIRRIGNLFTDRDFDLGFLGPIAANCKRLQETGLDPPFVHGVERCLARIGTNKIRGKTSRLIPDAKVQQRR